MDFATRLFANGQWSDPLPELDGPRTLVTAFGAPELRDDPTPVRELAAAYPRAVVVGCSTSGEILDGQVHDRSLAVAITSFERTTLRTAVAPCSHASESRAAGEILGRELAASGLVAVFVLAEGLAINGSELVAGLNAVLPDHVVVTGGLAGDGPRFERTWVLHDGALLANGVVAVGLYGAVQVTHGSRGGWDRFGPTRTITRSRGNVLYELDGQPALDLYKSYLGERAAGLPSTGLLFPLALQLGDALIVRTILAVDEEARSLTFAGDVAEGTRAQLMMANLDRLVEGAEDAALDAKVDQPALCIAVSCVGRRLVLRDRDEDETEAVLETLPEGSAMVGFYSYGELSPLQGGRCALHNQTMTLTTFRE